MRAPRGVVLAVLGAIALTGTVSGCGMSVFFPVVDESTPTGEEVDAALEPYYGQVIRWEDCGDFQCATALAPLDWDAPRSGEIELALIRQPARNERVGTLLVNPGGPGVSGYDAVARSLDLTATATLRDRYDIVGFDPRGVGRSTAVDCYDDAGLDQVVFGVPSGVRGTNTWLTGQNELTHSLGRACARRARETTMNWPESRKTAGILPLSAWGRPVAPRILGAGSGAENSTATGR